MLNQTPAPIRIKPAPECRHFARLSDLPELKPKPDHQCPYYLMGTCQNNENGVALCFYTPDNCDYLKLNQEA